MSLQRDEQEIGELVSTWMAATRTGDVEKVLFLMSDDVVSLMPGQPVMRNADFAAAARAQAGKQPPTFDGTSEIQEITILAIGASCGRGLPWSRRRPRLGHR
jgi:uncharacterized protein (TIGR02246 family)